MPTTEPEVNPLPLLQDFDEDEALVAWFVVGAIRSGGTMFEGRLHECRVARLLDGDLAPRGVWPWDVRLRDRKNPGDATRIEVRSGARSFRLDGGRDVHVWVIVIKPTELDATLRYCVAPAHRVADLSQHTKSLSRSRLEHEFRTCGDDQLAAEVARASRVERRHRKSA